MTPDIPDIMARADATIAATYKRFPIALVKGENCTLTDAAGKTYTDFLAGIAVCNLGHCHPKVTAAVTEQAGTLLHVSNLYYTLPQTELAGWLTEHSFADRVFFCNSGAEANEAAIKLARLHGHGRGIDAPEIIVADNAFHGRTLGALAATGNVKAQTGFGPLPAGFRRVPYGAIEAVEAAATAQTAAVFVEPIQGEGGINVPPDGYLSALRECCDRHGWLLMLDEVQSGVGRTGEWFAYQHEALRPDVVTLAKALANGVPIGACLAGGSARDVLGPGSHGTTFGGNPLAARAALAVLDTLGKDGLLQRAAQLGQRIRDGLGRGLDGHPGVVDIRGKGLMIGVEMHEPCTDLVRHALDAGLLVNVTAGRVIRLLPPLVLSDAEADEIVDRLLPLIHALAPSGDAARATSA